MGEKLFVLSHWVDEKSRTSFVVMLVLFSFSLSQKASEVIARRGSFKSTLQIAARSTAVDLPVYHKNVFALRRERRTKGYAKVELTAISLSSTLQNS